MPIDAWMPVWDVRSSHQVQIRAEPDVVYQSLIETDFGRNLVLRVLMGLRSVPALLLTPRRAFHQWRQFNGRRDFLNSAFTTLEDDPPFHLVLGLTGRFWTPAGGLVPTDPLSFRHEVPGGLARAAWGFQVEPVAPNRTRLTTETRVRCGDPASRRRFRLYWRIVSVGSGLIRWALLQQVKSAAENSRVNRNAS